MSIPKQSRKDSKEVDDFDISILKTLPRQLIGEAVNYIKNKKNLEELEARRQKKEEEEKQSKVKCIPPWAKTLAGERKPDERKDVATQYEIDCEGKEGEREKREKNQEKYLIDGSDIGGYSSGEEGVYDKEIREYSEEEGEEEWRRKMEDEGKEKGMEERSLDSDDEHGGVGENKLKGDRDKSDLEKENGMGEDTLKYGKIGSKDRRIDEEGGDLEDTDRDNNDQYSDGEDGRRKRMAEDGEDEDEKGSISSNKYEEAIELMTKNLKHGERGDEEYDRENYGDSSLEDQDEAGKGMSDSDYDKAHTESSRDKLTADGMSGGETRGSSTELLEKGEMEAGDGDGQVGEEATTQENVEERMGNDSKYLKKHFGNYLVRALSEIAWKRPADPIHYLAHRLYHYRHIDELTVKNYCEEKEIQEARNLYAMQMQEQTGISGETENIDEDEELEEAEIVAETVQEFEDIQESTSGDEISQFMSYVEPEERISPVELDACSTERQEKTKAKKEWNI